MKLYLIVQHKTKNLEAEVYSRIISGPKKIKENYKLSKSDEDFFNSIENLGLFSIKEYEELVEKKINKIISICFSKEEVYSKIANLKENPKYKQCPTIISFIEGLEVKEMDIVIK